MTKSLVIFFIFLKFSFLNAACPSGMIEGMDGSNKCYKINLNFYSYSSSDSTCLNQGGQLVSIKDTFTNSFIGCKYNTHI